MTRVYLTSGSWLTIQEQSRKNWNILSIPSIEVQSTASYWSCITLPPSGMVHCKAKHMEPDDLQPSVYLNTVDWIILMMLFFFQNYKKKKKEVIYELFMLKQLMNAQHMCKLCQECIENIPGCISWSWLSECSECAKPQVHTHTHTNQFNGLVDPKMKLLWLITHPLFLPHQ